MRCEIFLKVSFLSIHIQVLKTICWNGLLSSAQLLLRLCQFCSSVAQSCPTLCDPMDWRLPCPSPSSRACSNSCPLSQWCHPTISFSVIRFSSCRQSFSASQSFLMSRLFSAGGQSTGASASASVLPMNIQDWFPLELTLCTIELFVYPWVSTTVYWLL